MARAIRLAQVFHERAWPFLSEIGFELENDPAEVVGQHSGSSACYKSRIGFFLRIGFDPIDGKTAGIRCGRKWYYSPISDKFQGTEVLSNDYAVLANRFGFELPVNYELRVHDEEANDIDDILNDLRATLQTVMKGVTLDDLEAIESEEYGCQWQESNFGWQPSGMKLARISPFPE